MTTNPIAGNQFFTRVNNAAGQTREQNVADNNVVSLRATSVAANSLYVAALPAQVGKTLRSVTGFAPSTLVGGGAASYFLNNAPGVAAQASPASTNTNVMTIPAGAIIVSAVSRDATLAGGTITCGTQAVNGGAAASANTLFTATAATIFNTGAMVGQAAPAAIGAAATAAPFTTLSVAAAPTVTGVTITTSADMTASSGFSLTVNYLI